ncbi:hypothetical protein SRM1_03947 [Pseudomonas fluorescens]|nr:hypothetical protein SRM1_03947 [Pseudomonas fluorescens]
MPRVKRWYSLTNYGDSDTKKQSPEGSRLRGFYFRLHPLMIGERGGENTSVESVIHYDKEESVFARKGVVRVNEASTNFSPVT